LHILWFRAVILKESVIQRFACRQREGYHGSLYEGEHGRDSRDRCNLVATAKRPAAGRGFLAVRFTRDH